MAQANPAAIDVADVPVEVHHPLAGDVLRGKGLVDLYWRRKVGKTPQGLAICAWLWRAQEAVISCRPASVQAKGVGDFGGPPLASSANGGPPQFPVHFTDLSFLFAVQSLL